MADQPAIALAAVTRRFGGLAAVRGVTLAVPAGQRRAILGPNGAGKTTLFNVICGDFPPSEGQVALYGQDVSALPAWRRARLGVGRTYQTSMPFGGLSVRQNLFVAVQGARRGRFSVLRPRRDDEAMQAANHAAAQVRITHLLDHQAGALSHGQRRQLEIGMALAQNPRVLMLDEPAAGLSPTERPELVALLQGLPREVTLVMIEHDMDVALAVSELVTVMRDGEVVAERTPDAIQDDPVVRAIYLGDGGGAH
jgi:branched-chain amino acid transport system ATP-binding protein